MSKRSGQRSPILIMDALDHGSFIAMHRFRRLKDPLLRIKMSPNTLLLECTERAQHWEWEGSVLRRSYRIGYGSAKVATRIGPILPSA
jgi:hypothetical protein